jgi:hypothetical protein
LDAYFRAETAGLSTAAFAAIQTREDWESRRSEYRRQLQEMLGLWPLPERTDLKPVVTGTLRTNGVSVERLQFQSLPGLYVTANLYLPADTTNALPAILYACGHALMKTNGISFGNKTAYQHHGVWFARHGYACLMIDSLQLGEIEGLHHGTHREGMWWWNSRGYTPAGVEAWNGIRALDYLESRPEIDPKRIGMTGRSGGGSYTWTTAALDERIRAAAPVAGITDLANYVVDGCVEGHCDCMFFVNTYRWDYPLNAALIAPRPLLIVNTDSDTIFPLSGVIRTYALVRRIYSLLDAKSQLGLSIGPGPHKDTQDIQVPVLRWFDQHLKSQTNLVQDAAEKLFQPSDLAVFPPKQLPPDQRNARIQEQFVPAATRTGPLNLEAVRQQLLEKTFRAWPTNATGPDWELHRETTQTGVHFEHVTFVSQTDVQLSLFIASPEAGAPQKNTHLILLDASDWAQWAPAFSRHSGMDLEGVDSAQPTPPEVISHLNSLWSGVRASQVALAWLAPRGIGLDAWSADARKQTQIRRRFMLLGQTLDGMRAWDIRQACQVLVERGGPEMNLTIQAAGAMAVHGLYASLWEDSVRHLDLKRLPKSHHQGPDYLNVLKILDLPQTLTLARSRCQVSIQE